MKLWDPVKRRLEGVLAPYSATAAGAGYKFSQP